MNTYKIKNITNLLGKREYNYNSTLIIEYIDNMTKKKIKLEPDQTVILTINSLPISVHRLRVKKLVTVLEMPEIVQHIQKSVSTLNNQDLNKEDNFIKKQSSIDNSKKKVTALRKSK